MQGEQGGKWLQVEGFCIRVRPLVYRHNDHAGAHDAQDTPVDMLVQR